MAYTPTTWVEKVTTLGPTNMNKLEAGVQAASATADAAATAAAAAATTANAAIPKPASIASGETAVWNGSAFARSSVTNLAATSLGTGTPDATKYLRGDGAWTVLPTVGQEMVYTQITATVNITGLTEAAATTVVTAGSFTADGASSYMVEFFSPSVQPPTAAAGNLIIVCLFEGATEIGRFGTVTTPAAAAMTVPFRSSVRVTPTAASHTYLVSAFVTNTTGTPNVAAGLNGTNNNPPAYIRITKAN